MWAYRINVIVPAAARDALNALWTGIAPGGDDEADTFGVPLSADGGVSVTHYGMSTAGTEEMVSLVEALGGELAALGAVVSVQNHDSSDWAVLLAAAGLAAMEEAEA